MIRIVSAAPRQVASVADTRRAAAAEALRRAAAAGGGSGRPIISRAYNSTQTVKIYTKTGDAGETSLFDNSRACRRPTRASTPTARSTS